MTTLISILRLKWKPPSENSIDFKLVLQFPPLKSTPSKPDYHAKPFFALYVYCGDEQGRPNCPAHCTYSLCTLPCPTSTQYLLPPLHTDCVFFTLAPILSTLYIPLSHSLFFYL
ncbi:hypothetical protein DEU56DRAFT_725956 [Suillus clintonianus]|uniref:uncharacterized protein n=1 Tax=Suillus clintonianus TaxID=1904413 RepID=UPI001B870705|nr:uncharacterized protein DEU56DRAFT_725956 [Suillus clintonianus]KAG2154066.1 hypothetical protein DEU56DRAFT_725956 [Suillus clintonianus]